LSTPWRKVQIWPNDKYPLGDVPRRPGLYAVHLYRYGCVYIGKSETDISARLGCRVRPCGDGLWTCGPGIAVPPYHIWMTVSMRGASNLVDAERRLIERINPLFNVQHRNGRPMWDLCGERFRAEQAAC
jgi:hypothetical protein